MVALSLGLEEPETSAVKEIFYRSPDEVLICCGEECDLVEMFVAVLAAAAELVELRFQFPACTFSLACG
jgi:hypothetical protein